MRYSLFHTDWRASCSFLPGLDPNHNFRGNQKMTLEFLFPHTGLCFSPQTRAMWMKCIMWDLHDNFYMLKRVTCLDFSYTPHPGEQYQLINLAILCMWHLLQAVLLITPLSVGGKCGPPSLVNKSLWPYTLTQSQGSPRSLCFTPITDDPIPSSCFLPYNAQTCTWNATVLFSGNVTYLITCLLMSLCVLYSTKLWVLKQQGMSNLRSLWAFKSSLQRRDCSFSRQVEGARKAGISKMEPRLPKL